MPTTERRNLTLRLSAETFRKAEVLAAKRSTSVSALLAAQIQSLVDEDDAYERAAVSAIVRMRQGFHMGGGPMVSREELHER